MTVFSSSTIALNLTQLTKFEAYWGHYDFAVFRQYRSRWFFRYIIAWNLISSAILASRKISLQNLIKFWSGWGCWEYVPEESKKIQNAFSILRDVEWHLVHGLDRFGLPSLLESVRADPSASSSWHNNAAIRNNATSIDAKFLIFVDVWF